MARSDGGTSQSDGEGGRRKTREKKHVANTAMIYDVDAAKLSLKTECIILASARLITNTRPMAQPSRIDPRHRHHSRAILQYRDVC